MENIEIGDTHASELVDGLGTHLHDAIASFLFEHPEVPPAIVGLRVGQVFLLHFQLSYGDDFVKAARDTFELVLKNAAKPSRCDA